jgi:hypothetical protein
VPELLQQILCDCHQKFHACGHQLPRRKPLVTKTKPGPGLRRKSKKTYAKALKKGRVSRGRSSTPEEQIAGHREGSAYAAVIADRLRPVLAERGIPDDRFVAYFAFAQKLGRYARNYSGESLRMAASDLVDLYEAKSLNGDVLRAIAAALFDIYHLP